MLDLVRSQDWVIYPELERVLAPFIPVRGDGAIILADYRGLLVWEGVSYEFCEVVNDVMKTWRVIRVPVPARDYILQGSHLTLPVAKSLRDYQAPHWMPMAFRPLEICAAEQLEREKALERRQERARKAQRAQAHA
jgi:hypothetical protein